MAAPATDAVSDNKSAVSDNLSAAAEAAGRPALRINTTSHKKEWAALERFMQGEISVLPPHAEAVPGEEGGPLVASEDLGPIWRERKQS